MTSHSPILHSARPHPASVHSAAPRLATLARLHAPHRRSNLAPAFALAAAFAGAATGLAQAPAPADVADYLGTWTLSASFQGTPAELTLEIVDDQGTVKAALRSAMSPEPNLMDQITKSDAGLDLAYNADFGGSTARMHVKAALAEDKLTGTLGDEGGFFSAPFTGERAAEPAGIVAAALQGGGDSAVPQRRRGRRGLASSQAQLALDGKNVRVLFGELKVGSPDHQSFEQTADGAVFEYPGSRCMKLFTDLDLHFGDTKVAAANVAPDYPGVYGLWLKKTADGWRLVFNEEGDVWGTMHDPARDVAEIPLEIAALDTPQQELEVTLAEDGEKGGVLRIAWGDTAWSAKFTTR
jgi:Protein of unknown function (DUF2911)